MLRRESIGNTAQFVGSVGDAFSAICCLQIFRFTSSKPSKSAIASDEKFIRLRTNSFVRYCLNAGNVLRQKKLIEIQGQLRGSRDEEVSSSCLILRALKGTQDKERNRTRKRGGIAQLGEHLLCKQGVRSSSLLISTKNGLIAQVVRARA